MKHLAPVHFLFHLMNETNLYEFLINLSLEIRLLSFLSTFDLSQKLVLIKL
jgi:hypothetical protein